MRPSPTGWPTPLTLIAAVALAAAAIHSCATDHAEALAACKAQQVHTFNHCMAIATR